MQSDVGQTSKQENAAPFRASATPPHAPEEPASTPSVIEKEVSSASWLDLSERLEPLWESDPDAMLDELHAWLVAKRAWLSPRFNSRLHRLAEGFPRMNSDSWLHFHWGLLERLRSWVDDSSTTYALRWAELLILTAEAAHSAKRSTAAMMLNAEAWELRARFPDSVRYRLMASIATGFSAACAFAAEDFDTRYAAASAMLLESRNVILRRRKTSDAVAALFKVSHYQVMLTVRSVRHGAHTVMSAAQEVLSIIGVSTSPSYISGTPNYEDVIQALPRAIEETRGEGRAFLFELLLAGSDATGILGEDSLTVQFLDHAMECATTVSHRTRALLHQAKRLEDVVARAEICEEILRIVETGAFDNHSKNHQIRIIGQVARSFNKLNVLLRQQGMEVLAAFWREQAKSVRRRHKERGPGTGANDSSVQPLLAEGAPDVSDPETENPWGALLDRNGIESVPIPLRHALSMPNTDAANDERTGVALEKALPGAIRAENALLVIECLIGVSDLSLREAAFEGKTLRAAVVAAGEWRLREGEISYLAEVESSDIPDLGLHALLIALRISKTFVHFRVRRVLALLFRLPSLPAHQRMAFALEAAEYATRDHAWVDASQAIAAATELGVETGDSRVVGRLSDRLCEILDNIAVVSRSMVGIAEGLMRFKKDLITVYCTLSEAGFSEEAFRVGLRMIGRMEFELKQDPGRIKEFELFERHHRNPGSAASALFSLLKEEILIRSLHPGTRNVQKSAPNIRVPLNTLMLQILPARYADDRVKVLCAANKDGEVEYFSFDTAPMQVTSLSESIWLTLGDGNSSLKELHRIFIAPLGDRIQSAQTLIILADSEFPGLPIHAAHGPNGYLIDQLQVSYCTVHDLKSHRTRSIEANAIVGGWHPGINAASEAASISQMLREAGLDVETVQSARAARRTILHSEISVGILHIIAHGDFQEWPHASDSKLALSPAVSITAGEWMKAECNASFIFANACHAGAAANSAGDRSGFPLAFSLAGARAAVSALEFVPPIEAQEFAATFHRHFSGSGTSLSAYRAACKSAISQGWDEFAWVPYVHQGMPVKLRKS